MPSVDRKARYRVHQFLGLPFLCVALAAFVFGGGGSHYPLANLIVQIIALGALLLFSGLKPANATLPPRIFVVLCLASLTLPLLQIIPLPPTVWQALPGRELVQQSLGLLGSSEVWFPASVDRGRTFVALASLIPAAIALWLYPWGRHGAARSVIYLIIALGIGHFIFGALQIAAPGDMLNPYPVRSDGRLYGFFANHNSAGLFFVIAMCAAIGAFEIAPRRSMERVGLAACAILFLIGAILTNSRSSTALLLLPLGLVAWVAFWAVDDKRKRLTYGAVGAAVGAVILAGGAMLLSGTRLGATWERFSSLEDHRPEIWEDSLVSIDRFWPIGSGMGTFRDVFPVDESLEHVLAGTAGRAHNEYLELAIESGLFGMLLVLGWIVYLAIRVFAARKDTNWPVIRAAGLAGLCIFLQAFLDYPLRNQAMLCIAGLLIAAMVGREPSDKGS